jgi:soluble lytic murein transglycosylase-like protein
VNSRTLLIVLVALGALAYGSRKIVDLATDWKLRGEKYLPLLNAAEARHGIPRDLLVRLAYQESRFRDDIITGKTVSPAGALGIMQIVPKWHPNALPLNVPAAIDYAGRYLRQLYNRFGTWELALAAYNAGQGNVAKAGNKVPPFKETRDYVAQILGDWREATGGTIV